MPDSHTPLHPTARPAQDCSREVELLFAPRDAAVPVTMGRRPAEVSS